MPSDIVLRGDGNMPDDLSALLREPSPDGVWHLPGHAPAGTTGLVGRALRAVTGRAPRRSLPPGDEVAKGEPRFGLWLTEDHLLLADDRGPRAVRCEDIVRVRLRRMRRLLVLELRQGHLDFAIDWLDGWTERAGELRAEVDRRLKMGRTRLRVLEDLAASRQFEGFVRWLDTEVRRLKPDDAGRAQLLELTAVALASWPDETRRAQPDWFFSSDMDGNGRRGFIRDRASWLLPLCRVATFEAGVHFADAASVADCALTFRNVPLTGIELDGTLRDGPFEALLIWAATKPLRTLTVTGATERQQARLADFKRAHGIGYARDDEPKRHSASSASTTAPARLTGAEPT